MRYELNDREGAAIKPMLPNKPRAVPRVNDRRVLNGTPANEAIVASGVRTKVVRQVAPRCPGRRTQKMSLHPYAYGCALMSPRPSSTMTPLGDAELFRSLGEALMADGRLEGLQRIQRWEPPRHALPHEKNWGKLEKRCVAGKAKLALLMRLL